MAAIKLYTINKYVSANQPIVVETDNDELFDSFYLDTGENLLGPYLGTQREVGFTYQINGSKSVILIGLSGGNTKTTTFTDFFHVIEFEKYDPNVVRIFEITPLTLPWECPVIAPNEWINEDNINAVFHKFFDNLNYLNESSKIYNSTPTEYIGWFGTFNANFPKWWAYLNSEGDPGTSYLKLSSAQPSDLLQVNDIKFRENLIWMASKGDDSVVRPTLYIMKDTTVSEELSGNITEITQKSPQDYYGKIGAFDFDSNGTLFVLDSKFQEVAVYSYQPTTGFLTKTDNVTVTYLFKWGGKSSFLAKTKFVNAIDLHVDNSSLKYKDTILIVDNGNFCVKRFSSTGTWISTTTHSEMSGKDLNGPISVTTDRLGNFHVLTHKKVLVFTDIGEFLFEYDNKSDQVPKKILSNYGPNGFIYIVFDHQVLKFTDDGRYAGEVTNILNGLNPPEFFSATQNANGNLYVTANNAILKFVDVVQIISIKGDTSTLDWAASSVLINREEYVQDWVYNRGFIRLWDNLEYFRRSVYNKFVSNEIQPGIKSLITNTFTINDEIYFSNNKNDIIIGINEFVTADVVNRVVNKLCDNVDILTSMLVDQPLTIPPNLEFCWSWEETSSTGQNPTIWTDVSSSGLIPTIWVDSRSTCCILV